MKTCTRCEQRKELSSFTKNATRKDGLNSACRECHTKYTKQHYAANKAYYLAKARVHNEAMRELIDAAKRVPCLDCKRQFNSWQMDFDHVRGVKKFELGSARRKGWSRARVLAEMKKCDVVCANCHRDRTHKRQHASVDQLDRSSVYETEA